MDYDVIRGKALLGALMMGLGLAMGSLDSSLFQKISIFLAFGGMAIFFFAGIEGSHIHRLGEPKDE